MRLPTWEVGFHESRRFLFHVLVRHLMSRRCSHGPRDCDGVGVKYTIWLASLAVLNGAGAILSVHVHPDRAIFGAFICGTVTIAALREWSLRS